jgi:hypothetical protein
MHSSVKSHSSKKPFIPGILPGEKNYRKIKNYRKQKYFTSLRNKSQAEILFRGNKISIINKITAANKIICNRNFTI